jgi:hypothetical protein
VLFAVWVFEKVDPFQGTLHHLFAGFFQSAGAKIT